MLQQKTIQKFTARLVTKIGDVMSGILNIGSYHITSVAEPLLAQYTAMKNYVDLLGVP